MSVTKAEVNTIKKIVLNDLELRVVTLRKVPMATEQLAGDAVWIQDVQNLIDDMRGEL